MPGKKIEKPGPCPFCGYSSTVDDLGLFADHYWKVQCNSNRCGAEGPGRKMLHAAIRAWNLVALPASRKTKARKGNG